MSIISFPFLIFIIILLITYYGINPQHQWKVLLIGSIVFYAWVRPIYIVFIAVSIVSTWALMKKPSRSRWIMTLIVNLGILIVFRYSVYFNIHSLIVPLGISFYTFMTLGYAHDCMGKKTEPEQNLFHYALFISYFPQITQGPIGTYQNMKDQLFIPHEFNLDNIKLGGYRVIKGLFKYQEYHEYFLKLMAVYDAPYILAHDVDFDNHNPDYFEDMSHMSGEGRRMYTKELIKHLPVSD